MGVDKHIDVNLETGRWEHGWKSLEYQKEILRKSDVDALTNENMIHILETVFNPQVKQLQQKYYKEIQINTMAFEHIQLTNIDMFAISERVPWPVLVPDFPLLTTDHEIDYGKKLETQNDQ